MGAEVKRGGRGTRPAQNRAERDRRMDLDMGTSLIFSLAFAGRKKGRESKTVRERQAYSPEGYCISPLPAMNDRRMHLYLYMCRGHKKRQGLRGWLPVSEEFSAPRTGKHSRAGFVKILLLDDAVADEAGNHIFLTYKTHERLEAVIAAHSILGIEISNY